MSLERLTYERAAQLREECRNDLSLAVARDLWRWVAPCERRLASLNRIIERIGRAKQAPAGIQAGPRGNGAPAPVGGSDA